MALFSQIHEICFHGQGGYDWEVVYNMPIWLRHFTFKKIQSYYEQQNSNKQQKAEESWLSGEAREAAAKNKNQVKIPSFIKAPEKQ